MIEEHTLFLRELKVDDYAQCSPQNLILIAESSNPLYGPGAKVWDSCMCLAKTIGYLHQQRVFNLQNKTVVELGCGAGLLSIYLAALGAQVLATDLPPVRELAQKNISANKLVTGGRVSFHAFNWNQEFIIPLQTAPLLFAASEPFVAGAEAFECFMKCVKKLLTRFQSSQLILGFKLRDNDLSRFESTVEDMELSCERIQASDMHPDYADDRIVIYTLRF